MWILTYLPDFVTHLIVLIGLGLIIVTSVPFVWKLVPGLSSYQRVIQLAGVVILSFGFYLEGGLSQKQVWETKVSELEGKLSKALVASAKVDTKIVTETITKKEIIREKGRTVTEYIDREIKVYDDKCPLPQSIIRAHNAAASNELSHLTTIDPTEHNKLATPTIKLAPKTNK